MTGKLKFAPLVGITLIAVSYSGAYLRPLVNSASAGDCRKFASVFEGFAYAGAYDCPDFRVPPHGVAPRNFPDQFAAEKCYVFHQPSPSRGGVFDLLLRRLKENEIEPTRYPGSAKDLMYPMEGDPLFRIDFRAGRNPGSILSLQGNHGVSTVADRWTSNDYVLIFKKR
jgi:hypothetical protein